MDDTTTPQPPRLPPRKSVIITPPPPPLAAPTEPGPPVSLSDSVSSAAPTISEPVVCATQTSNITATGTITSPPSLPRRKSVNRPVPSPVTIPISDDPATAVANLETASSYHDAAHERHQNQNEPDSGVTVAVTPATPQDSEAGTAPTSPSFGQTADELQNASRTAGVSVTDTRSEVRSSYQQETIPQQRSPPPLPARTRDTHPAPPALPARRSKATVAAAATVPSLAWVMYTASLVILAYFQISFTGLIAAALAGYLGVKKLESTAEHVLRESIPERATVIGPGGGDAVDWVNHALYALFPLISTDVLTPFVDLMEDALAEQVPPIVTSVRLSSPALGSQPLLLTSLRPMSDQEWFSSLSTGEKEQKRRLNEEHQHRHKSSLSKTSVLHTSPLKGKGKHARNVSAGSAPMSASMSRSRSASSTGSAFDSEDLAKETQRRRKRDRIIHKISGRRGPASDENRLPDFNASSQLKGLGPRGAEDSRHAYDVADGEREMGGSGDNDMDEDDPNAGQYVNYQIGFEYKRSKEAEEKGKGLHCLAYFGWGVKGVGKSEIPVYIDVISIKGTVNVRLLLSATPPFVRTGTFSFPSLPDYDVSAHPLKKGAFNAMELPGMKHYVKQSITEVASAFVQPNSYTMDLDRLLLGGESALRTGHIGVLRVIIHKAEDLPKADTMGSCDPYVSISFSKFHKPLFSTRTIVDTRDPVWDEEAFILVSTDSIEAGERLRLRASDSDRFSADDAVGVVEVDLAELVDSVTSKLYRRRDRFQADRPGMRSSGTLEWSVQFHPLWQMPQEETQARILKAREARTNFGEPGEQKVPWWMEWIERMVDGKDEKWVKERQERRNETMAWFTGEKERDELEAATKPSDQYRSGILQFHIHQCVDLEVEPNNGTYSSHTTSSRSAANGKPALASLVDRTPTENPEPPSAYAEVHLNDKLVYRTRTKQVTPLPYFNAVSERFVRDWTKGKVVIVVRDERNREHDPILGMVVIPLKEAFKSRSQFTRWFPLVGGLGWGRIRISLLWKPIDMSVSRGVSGYEVATLRLRSFSFTSLGLGLGTDKSISVILQTDADKYELNSADSDDVSSSTPSSTPATSAIKSLERIQAQSTYGHSGSGSGSNSNSNYVNSPSRASLSTSLNEEIEMEFDLSPRHVRLAIMYRHSCSLVITFVSRSSVLKKKKVLGIGVVRLPAMPDGEGKVIVGVWGTEDVGKVMRMEEMEQRRDAVAGDFHGSEQIDGGEGEGFVQTPMPMTAQPGTSTTTPEKRASFRRRISERRSWPVDSRTPDSSRPDLRSSPRGSRSSLSLRSTSEPPLLGWAELSFNLIPGIGKTHRKIAKRDLRFAKVFEAWEAGKELTMGWDRMGEGERIRDEFEGVKEGIKDGLSRDQDDSGSGSSSDDDDNDDDSSNDDEADHEHGNVNGRAGGEDGSKTRVRGDGPIEDSEDEDEKRQSERRAHSHALHKRHKGVFQLKIARTGRFVKDKIGAKIYSATNSGGGKDARHRGTDMDVEKEGVSRM